MQEILAQSPALIRRVLDALRAHVHVITGPLADDVACLVGGAPTVLYFDTTRPTEDQAWALADVVTALTLGPDRAKYAQVVRRLRLVS